MTTFKPEELVLLKKYANKAVNVLEFGVGESTELFNASDSVQSIVSVESDRNWLAAMVLKDLSKVDFTYVEMGTRPNTWGQPTEEFKKVWSYYSDQALKHPNVDTVFVDGRFRVACMLKAAITCGDDCVFIIHDYNWRPYYFILEDFLEKIEEAENLAIFKKKECDHSALEQTIRTFETDWR